MLQRLFTQRSGDKTNTSLASDRGFTAFAVTLLVSLTCGAAISLSGLLERAELQSINSYFETRRWLCWSPISLDRLKPARLWNYHQSHDIPLTFWSWDYTLSWLIENNHPPVQQKFVIFNHLLEDEPPSLAVTVHPWLEPLLHYPTPRKTVAEAISYLAKSGAKIIILDNDFPQYGLDDALLANTIHNATNGNLSGTPVPVLMARTINHRSFANALQLDAGTAPVGILNELAKLEPGVDVVNKYTGLTTILPDNDQVIRRMLTHLPDSNGNSRQAIIAKAAELLDKNFPAELPTVMDIDFAREPNSDLYPVRPFTYLLDPQLRAQMLDNTQDDVTIKDAIVLLGDGIVDVYSTPYTNTGVNLMSGTEIIANGIDTILRRSYPQRLNNQGQWLYLLLCSLAAAVMVLIFQPSRSDRNLTQKKMALLVIRQSIVFLLITAIVYCSGILLFAYAGLIVPANTAAISVAIGIAASLLWESERQRLQAWKSKLENAQLALTTERQRHEAELQIQATENRERQLLADQVRRKEFTRRLNHDLKAPVTVLNWTLAKLQREGLQSGKAQERIDNIARTSDRLFDLIAELVRTYDAEIRPASENMPPATICDLYTILSDCVKMHQPLAESKRGTLTLNANKQSMPIQCPSLQLARIVDNLIRNAFIHNEAGTVVTIAARTKGGDTATPTYEITISDNGKGLPAEIATMLSRFNPYPPAPLASQENGLGLNIVQSLVTKLEGQISLGTQKSGGSTIIISLPGWTGITEIGTPTLTEKSIDRQEELCVELL